MLDITNQLGAGPTQMGCTWGRLWIQKPKTEASYLGFGNVRQDLQLGKWGYIGVRLRGWSWVNGLCAQGEGRLWI
jgi:hypothetical protein